MIYPHLWDNPKFEGLGLDGFAVWAYMISQADDEGRAPLSLRVLAYRPFLIISGETKEPSDIEEILSRMEAAGLCSLYRDSGRRFYQMHDWQEHQKIHKNIRKSSTYPEPNGYKPYVGTTEELRSHYVETTEELRPKVREGKVRKGNVSHQESDESPIIGDSGEGNPPSLEEANKVAKALREAALEATGGKGKLQPEYHDLDRIMVLLSRSNYTCEDLLAMIEFARGDPFWRAHVLSGSDLEKHADTLYAKTEAKEAEPPKEQGRPQPPMVNPNEYGSRSGSSPEIISKVMKEVREKIGSPKVE